METNGGNGSKLSSDFEAIWDPRIGPEATRRLWTYTRFSRRGYLWLLLPVGAGVLIGSGWLGDILGGIFAVATVWSWGMFIYAQRRTAMAISRWRGIEIRWLPRMTPDTFDKFCQKYAVPEHDEIGSETEVRDIGLLGPRKPDAWPDEPGITRWRRKRAEKAHPPT
jgi:hypothetical protein